ncbi:MAG: 7-cyano-7-deazaguanine synthase, partial [Chloroflexi bacterium]|nr:7-cyano-7-deazaguanine synthase [Chloroflexota bacterium]
MTAFKAIAVVSGGMDSITLAYLLDAQGYQLHLLSFDYGQRHKKELFFAQLCAERLNAAFDVIDLTSITRFLKGSALTDTVPVPDGHYAAPNMAITVVPNRNAIMLSVAYAVAVAEHANIVAAGVHAGDHFVYPDCRPDFIKAFD